MEKILVFGHKSPDTDSKDMIREAIEGLIPL